MMRGINKATGTTFLLVTHNPEVGNACDRIIQMRDGVYQSRLSSLILLLYQGSLEMDVSYYART